MEKPGVRTSEFWMTLLAVLVVAVLSSGLFAAGSVAVKILGIVGAVLASLGYTASRTSVKNHAALGEDA